MRYNNKSSFLTQVKSAASTGFLSRVYFLGVPNDYERREICNSLLRYLPGNSSLERFSGLGLDLKRLFDHLQTSSLFGGEPVALIEDAEKIPKQALQSLFPLSYGYLILAARGKCAISDSAEKEGIVLDLLSEKPWEKEKRILAQLEAKVRSTGKAIAADTLALLLERQDLDSGVLEREIDKLICYTGERLQIQSTDVLAISTSSRSFALWQTAESIIWEGTGVAGEDHFHSLVPALRAQLQLGLKISSLLSTNASREEWSAALPKVFPKTLEKRMAQAERLGMHYFAKGLIELFDIELKSRTGANQLGALLDLFRIKLVCYAR